MFSSRLYLQKKYLRMGGALFLLMNCLPTEAVGNSESVPRRFTSQAAADSAYSDWEHDAVGLEAVVVTGTRTPKTLKDVPIQTRLISSEDIRKSDATNVQDLLEQELPGVEFSKSYNQQTHLNFSGFGGQSVLFLVDGERMAGETMDDVDFARLNMNNVERIEIVKGAASALYGSNATGGVINLITKQPKQKWTLNLNGRGSKHNERRYGMNFGLNGTHVRNLLSFTGTNIDNYSFHNGPDQKAVVISNFYGDETWHVDDKLTWSPTSRLQITAKAGYFFRQQVRTVTVPERFRDFTGGLRGIYKFSDSDQLEVVYHFDQYDKSDYQKLSGLDVRDYSNVLNSVRALYNHTFGQGDILTVGADCQHDYLFNKNLQGEEREQDSFDAFAQYDWNISDQWELVSAIRYDYFSDGSESRVTPKLSARYKPLADMCFRFGYGMGFRAPSLKEKYYNFDMAGIWIIQGNAGLVPEVSHNFNASVEYSRWQYNFTLSGYYNQVKDRLATGSPFVDSSIDPEHPDQLYLSYINLKDYRTYGFDVSAGKHWSNGISARVSYAYVHEELPTDANGESINNQYVPARSHSLSVRTDWEHRFTKHYALTLGINGRALSGVDNLEFVDYRTKGDDGKLLRNEIHYDPYSVWKLSCMQQIGKAVRITLALDNLFNYKPDYYYLNAPLTDGIRLQVGASIDVDGLFR